MKDENEIMPLFNVYQILYKDVDERVHESEN